MCVNESREQDVAGEINNLIGKMREVRKNMMGMSNCFDFILINNDTSVLKHPLLHVHCYNYTTVHHSQAPLPLHRIALHCTRLRQTTQMNFSRTYQQTVCEHRKTQTWGSNHLLPNLQFNNIFNLNALLNEADLRMSVLSNNRQLFIIKKLKHLQRILSFIYCQSQRY